MKKLLQQELAYSWRSKTFLVFTLFLTATFCAVMIFELSGIFQLQDSYQKYLTFYTEQGVDLSESEYTVQESTDGLELIENPLAYTKEKMAGFLYALSPEYRITRFLELSCVIFPLLLGAWGAYTASYDTKYKTLKMKVCSSSKTYVFWSKQVSMFVLALISVFIDGILSYIVGELLYRYACEHLSADFFPAFNQSTGSILLQIVHAVVVAILYLEIGFLIGNLTHSLWPAVLFAILYLFIIPTSEATAPFDIRDAINYFSIQLYSFPGIFSIPKSAATFPSAVLLLAITLLLLPLINGLLFKKRSAYQ